MKERPVNIAVEIFSIIEDNDSSQSLGWVWNVKNPNSLHESNTLPGKYMTPKNEKHFETNFK